MKELLKIIKQNYENIPYHNFWLVLRNGFNPSNQGGICTDKNYFLFEQLQEIGYSVKLHSAKINGQYIHQLLKIEIENQSYLIDTGLGFPILEPIPLFENAHFNAYGYEFKTEIIKNELNLFRLVNNKQVLSYTTDLSDCNQKQVLEEYVNSYNDNIQYPFKNSIRFSKIVNNEFYFLKGNILYYSENNRLKEREIKTSEDFNNLFENTFVFDLKTAQNVAIKLQMFEF